MPIGQQYRDALGVLRVKGPPMPNGQYRDALGVLRVKGPPMPNGQYRDALGVLRGAALVRSEWRAAWTQ